MYKERKQKNANNLQTMTSTILSPNSAYIDKSLALRFIRMD